MDLLSLVELAHDIAGRVNMREELDRTRRQPTDGTRGFLLGGLRSVDDGGPSPARLGVSAPPGQRSASDWGSELWLRWESAFQLHWGSAPYIRKRCCVSTCMLQMPTCMFQLPT
jgi:hypothetical protein